MSGINLDPLNQDGAPSPAMLAERGVKAVRLVSRPGVESYIDQCKANGLYVLAVVAQESQGFLVYNADCWQIGNEPDGSGPSSWQRTPQEYAQDWDIYRGTYPGLLMVAAGLVSGQPSYLEQVLQYTSLPGCDAICVHPYAKNAQEAENLLEQYDAIRPDLLLWVTEWNRPGDEVIEFAEMLSWMAERSFWFCWSDGMVSPFGLVTSSGEQKPELWLPAAALPKSFA